MDKELRERIMTGYGCSIDTTPLAAMFGVNPDGSNYYVKTAMVDSPCRKGCDGGLVDRDNPPTHCKHGERLYMVEVPVREGIHNLDPKTGLCTDPKCVAAIGGTT